MLSLVRFPYFFNTCKLKVFNYHETTCHIAWGFISKKTSFLENLLLIFFFPEKPEAYLCLLAIWVLDQVFVSEMDFISFLPDTGFCRWAPAGLSMFTECEGVSDIGWSNPLCVFPDEPVKLFLTREWSVFVGWLYTVGSLLATPPQCWVVGSDSRLPSVAFCCKRNHRQMEKPVSEGCPETEAMWEQAKMSQKQRKLRWAKTETNMPSQWEQKLKISPAVRIQNAAWELKANQTDNRQTRKSTNT